MSVKLLLNHIFALLYASGSSGILYYDASQRSSFPSTLGAMERGSMDATLASSD